MALRFQPRDDKPHIRPSMIPGMWACSTKNSPVGIGPAPLIAYWEWMLRARAAWPRNAL